MKKGFTLIELLAVIVILAIIATIATPIVLNIINDVKESATLRSAEYYLDAVETSIATSILKNANINDGAYKLKDGDICLDSSCTQKLEVQIKGEKPQSGYIRLTEEGLIGLAISDGNFCVTKELNDSEIKIKDYVEGECGIDFLKAPTISLSDSVLNIVSNDDGTEKYKIYIDGKLETTILAQDTTNIIENDGNIIRAGTYRFNDVLSVPSTDLSTDLNFYLTTTSPVLGMQIEVFCNEIKAYVDDFYVAYTVYETNPENALRQTGNYAAYALSYDGWLTSYHGFGIQTITIAEEQEVSAEFYNWFISNVTQLTTYNLYSLNLEDGNHEINVKTVAKNYKESPESNVVSYEIGESVLGDIIYPTEPAERLERLYMGLDPIEICGRLVGASVDSGNIIYYEYYYYPYDYGGDDSSFARMVDAFQDGYYLGLGDEPAIFRKITNVNGNVAYLGTTGTPDNMINVPIILIGEAGTYSYYIDVPNYASGTWTITLPSDGVAVIELFVGWIGHVDVYNKDN